MPRQLGLRRVAMQGILRNHRKGQGFLKGQLAGAFVEIDQARRGDAFHVATIRREVHVGFKDFVLGVEKFQLDGVRICRSLPGMVRVSSDAGGAPVAW